MTDIDWPLRYRCWKAVHEVVNAAAWRWGGPSFVGPERERSTAPLWRLNDWVAGHWVEWYLVTYYRGRHGRSDPTV